MQWASLAGLHWHGFQHTKAETAVPPSASCADRDRWELWLERPPDCIHPNWSECRDPLFLPSAQVLSVKSLSCRVKGHANSHSIFLLLDHFIQLHLSQAHTPSPSLSSPSFTLHQWCFGLLICLEERSLTDEHYLSYQAQTWNTAGNQCKNSFV